MRGARGASEADFLMDAIRGTGFRLPLNEEVSAVLSRVEAARSTRFRRPLCVAVDCPSGLDCDSGAQTLAAAKPGWWRFPGASLVGEIVVGEIGLNPGLKELSEVQMELADAKTVRAWMPSRPPESHKGTFGKVVIAPGPGHNPGPAGRGGGAGPRHCRRRLLGPSESILRGRLGFVPRASEAAPEAVPLPQLIIDADGLRLLAALEDWPARPPPGSVLPPHPRETSALAGPP